MYSKTSLGVRSRTRVEENAETQSLISIRDDHPVPTVEGPPADSEAGDHPHYDLNVKRWEEPSSEAEDDPSIHYNVNETWKSLFNLPSCQQLMIKEAQQHILQLEVGKNVTQEFPWKQIKFKDLQPCLLDIEGGKEVITALAGYDPENPVLIGFTPLLTQNQDDPPEGDPFIMFCNPDEARLALAFIRNIEAYERWVINRRLVKKPRRWVSLGSENEVNVTIEQQITEPLDVEIQSVYPLPIPADKAFTYRKVADVRDGYVELLPAEHFVIENVVRKRVTVGIQTAPEVKTVEQQTNPTFPTNAWAQYLYEIKEDEELDETSEEEGEGGKDRKSKPPTPAAGEAEVEKKPPPEVSENIIRLLDKLEFNQIDMYRNDYIYISDKAIEHYTTPVLEETLCFANISKSYKRFVCGIDWYPRLSGLIVTSYTFNTACTVDSVTHRDDIVQRAVLQPNPTLMWSFSDNLNYKLEFESPREITVLSFCPHNSNLLFGGANNGQIILWDLQGRAEKLDYEEVLTTAQAKYRVMIADYFNWTITVDEDSIVPPATTSGLEVSQSAAITGIYWLSKHFYVNSFGKVYTDPDKKVHHKIFVSSAIDGTVSFWDLDSLTDQKSAAALRRDQPKVLTQSESIYKGKTLRPMFTVAYHEPITAIVADTSVFSCIAEDPLKKRKHVLNFRTSLKVRDPPEMRQSFITSSFYGRIDRLNWLGLYTDANGKETVQAAIGFARVHDGPIISMKKNPFLPQIFVSIGRNIFAVWHENYNYTPIFWRKSVNDLTAVAWSETRPAVLFLTRIDGNLEAWDILSRDDDACFNDILGGGIITAISEHRPSDPEKLLGIGDYNSSFRMVKLPTSFYAPEHNELARVKEYYRKEEARKKAIQAWEQKYYENNRDIIEAKREAEIEARKELERAEKESRNVRKTKEATPDDKEGIKALSYTERMKRQWDQLNLNRLLSILMTRKRVNAEQLERETRLEKEHLAYEAAKKASLARILQNVNEEVSQMRSRILPAEKVDLKRIDLVLSSVKEVMETVDTYDEIESEANEIVQNFEAFDTLDYIVFLQRGMHRRLLLNKAVGGNTERLYWYDCAKDEDILDSCDWGYEKFVLAYLVLLEREEAVKMMQGMASSSSVSIRPSAMDQVPVDETQPMQEAEQESQLKDEGEEGSQQMGEGEEMPVSEEALQPEDEAEPEASAESEGYRHVEFAEAVSDAVGEEEEQPTQAGEEEEDEG